MSNQYITIYKLMILYAMSKVNSPLPGKVFYDFITGNEYTNYFTVQSALGELIQSELIREESTYHRSYYALTDTGRETLELFGGQLSYEIRREITQYLKKNQYEILNETSIVSDYRRASDGSYLASCAIREDGNPLFSLSLSVPTEEDARKICDNWKEQSAPLYQQALRLLLIQQDQ